MDGEPDCLCPDHPIPVRVFRNDGSLVGPYPKETTS